MPTLLQRFAEAQPEVRVKHRELPPGQRLELLTRGEMDANFIGPPGATRVEGLGFLLVAATQWKIAMGKGHRLADREEVSMVDLAG